MSTEITNGEGLLSQIQGYNQYDYNSNLTLKDFESMFKSLTMKGLSQNRDIKGRFTKGFKSNEREFVMLTGFEEMFMFDLAMQGIKLPTGVTYSKTTFKKLPGVLYINIGRKESFNKIKINMYDKIYSPYLGTVKLGDYNTVDEAVKQFKL